MNKVSLQRNMIVKYCVFALCGFMMAGCAGVKLISAYDEVTDKSLTAIQQKTDDFIETLIKQSGTDEASFSKHQAFYNDIDQQLRQLEFRVNSIPKNDKTVNLVKNIRSAILGEGNGLEDGNSLRDLHCMTANRDKGPSAKVLEINRRSINQTISAALSLELAKKQGLEDKEQSK